jgi:hypothetical protein
MEEIRLLKSLAGYMKKLQFDNVVEEIPACRKR